jgi:AbrB family looped-hinge helix DNA binding protein
MIAMARLASKGRVTIPRSVRDHLKVDTGSMLIFEVKKDRVVVRPARTLHDLAGVLKGRGPKGRDSEAMRRAAKAHVSRRVMARG